MEEILDKEKLEKINRYKILNQYVKKGQILFTGSSLMEQFPIYEFIQDYDIRETIYNRGIGGFTTTQMLQYLDVMIFELEPSKVFINIGTNDLNEPDYSLEALMGRCETIIKQIIEHLPECKIYYMAYYPVNGEYDFGDEDMKQVLKIRTNKRINEANSALEQMAEKNQIHFININRNLYDRSGNLKPEYSIEGMHMYGNGYHAILEDLLRFVRE
ncbi:lysophospholipase [Anaerocolumna sedimenticola]|uniref:Lysophospholipase n=1 Tax=Anaerocolumna sedimenticola TaxID=2696063 RepID=A0A6P1TI98_9FIRM|nr:GDSL-type esterase/lipase family protein [Anaerocolumna sedimenticola]QHQ59812.1 lysophospholipase [Anaerocolumna sedimenticola]